MLDNTKGVCDKIKTDFNRFRDISNIVTQLVFIIYYAYSVAINVGYLHRLIIYSVLLALGVGYFAVYMIYYARKDFDEKHQIVNKKQKKSVKKGSKYAKLSVQFCAIALSLYEIATLNLSDLTIILKVIPMFAFVIQVAVEIINSVIENYFDMIKTAIEADIKPIMPAVKLAMDLKEGGIKGLALSAVDAPLQFISKKISGEQPVATAEKSNRQIKTEEKVEELRQQYKEKRIDEKISKKQDAIEGKIRREAKEKEEIKQHFKQIKNEVKTKLLKSRADGVPTNEQLDSTMLQQPNALIEGQSAVSAEEQPEEK